MAITAAALAAALGTEATVYQHQGEGAAIQSQYVVGNPGTAYAGRAQWVDTTASDNAATQAAAVLAGLW